MPNHSRMTLLLAAIVVSSLMRGAFAGDCCARCGCNDRCDKICRLVREEKKVDIICWGAKCEDFCVPGPSERGCRHCEEVCQSCDKPCDDKEPYGASKTFVWTDWIPGCASVHTKKKLMQKIVTKKVNSYKWVVEDLCPECEAKTESADVEPGDKAPPPPAGKVKLK